MNYTLENLEDFCQNLSVSELSEAIEEYTGQSLDGMIDHLLYDENNIPYLSATIEIVCETAMINCEDFYNHLIGEQK